MDLEWKRESVRDREREKSSERQQCEGAYICALTGRTHGSSTASWQMSSLLARTYGRSAASARANVVGHRSASFSGASRLGKMALGGATLPKTMLRANSLMGVRQVTGAPHRRKSCLTGGQLGIFFDVRGGGFRGGRAANSANAASRKRKMAACGANLKRGVAKRRKRDGSAFGAKGSCLTQPKLVAACGASDKKVERQHNTCAEMGRDLELMVGPSQESDAMHSQRHSPDRIGEWAKVCPRCFFLQWQRAPKAPSWLAPKPKFMSGAWGLGCMVCAASKHSSTVQTRRREHMRQNQSQMRCKQAVSRSSKWSNYSMRALGSARDMHLAIHQHQITDLHRLSENCFQSASCHFDAHSDPRGHSAQRTAHSQDVERRCETKQSHDDQKGGAAMCHQMVQPAAHQEHSPIAGSQRRQSVPEVSPSCQEPVATSSSTSAVGSTADPFRGRVPQIQEWIDVWAETTSAMSTDGDV